MLNEIRFIWRSQPSGFYEPKQQTQLQCRTMARRLTTIWTRSRRAVNGARRCSLTLNNKQRTRRFNSDAPFAALRAEIRSRLSDSTMGRIKVHLDADCTSPVDIYYARNCLFTAGWWRTSSTFFIPAMLALTNFYCPAIILVVRSARSLFRSPGWSACCCRWMRLSLSADWGNWKYRVHKKE